MWVLSQKGDKVRAHLVERGYDEGDVRKDFTTIGKSTMRLFLTIAASKGWTVKTTGCPKKKL